MITGLFDNVKIHTLTIIQQCFFVFSRCKMWWNSGDAVRALAFLHFSMHATKVIKEAARSKRGSDAANERLSPSVPSSVSSGLRSRPVDWGEGERRSEGKEGPGRKSHGKEEAGTEGTLFLFVALIWNESPYNQNFPSLRHHPHVHIFC